MKKLFILLILLVITTLSFSQKWVVINGHSYVGGGGPPTDPVVVAQFNMTPTAQNIAGWTDWTGNPDNTIVIASDTRSGQTITASTVNLADPAYWNPYSNNSAYVTLSGSGHVLPTELYRSYFFNYTVGYTPGKEQLSFSGFTAGKTYKFEFLSSRQGAPNGDVRKTILTCVDAGGSQTITAISANWNGSYNITFTGKVPVSGVIKFGFVKGPDGDFGYVNAVKITQE